ncbi:2,5-diamino-6-(ribosylamino)-4(3H)-pyrimidinone 5'-phosphate reductase [Lunasporangiospora selenospora]|uniref:2,5-diamino-6-ribosylamino-4(3H)-pyrimidinone 5'-phosphate reductase n=1 Tax=Lunasporangiospora selenospora TaxID=979761 RepID=A0A9P6KA06_9FUNG|nr:2,5-diamino-6-(ribosylamino)-4(3H)-pyrimidinone 5'-phosphate reductase [Lunasporangiospora selenospora]
MYSFLSDHSFLASGNQSTPFVTLTFAQSLDGKIAGTGGQQLILSGPESMKATHIMRSRHDAILVGIGTVLNDDPRLTVRLDLNDPELPRGTNLHHPQPIILDSTLRFPTSATLLLATAPKRPWIFTTPAHDPQRKLELEALGAKVFVLPSNQNNCKSHQIDVSQVISALGSLSIKSLMVEGGAGVIASFLKSGCVDLTLITIAPTYVGQDGISAVYDAEAAPQFKNVVYFPLGRDVMMVAIPCSKQEV